WLKHTSGRLGRIALAQIKNDEGRNPMVCGLSFSRVGIDNSALADKYTPFRTAIVRRHILQSICG
ncbi:hypothetical protein, partial [Chitinibacter sp. ZOR0017]|uniref:hypothetical protein n=1 Tax=Chitinibacter sp. ZOR0017 TaxID=1339254 RepID=UPI001E5B2231